jgi:bacterioferritin-associated ferredoxin
MEVGIWDVYVCVCDGIVSIQIAKWNQSMEWEGKGMDSSIV